ncbi:transposase-like protein [Corynebacterium diphtheriae DSM 43988]|nr:transposase-like protein [Corynebacterium diphtheriae DSM 43988]
MINSPGVRAWHKILGSLALQEQRYLSLVDLPIVGYPTRIYVRLPRYRCTNKCCLQKIFHAGLACAPDNPKTTNRVPHWLLQHLGQCTLKPEEPPNGGISKDFAQNFTPNRKKTGRLGRFGVKCRLLGGERG